MWCTAIVCKVIPKKAKKAGLPRERFCRRVLNDTIVQEAPPAEFSELIRQVKRTGSNIDQLLKMARANGFLQLTELQLAIDHNLSTEQRDCVPMEWPSVSRLLQSTRDSASNISVV